MRREEKYLYWDICDVEKDEWISYCDDSTDEQNQADASHVEVDWYLSQITRK